MGLPAEFGEAYIVSSQCTGVSQTGDDGHASKAVSFMGAAYAKSELDPVSIASQAGGLKDFENGLASLKLCAGTDHPVMALGSGLNLQPATDVEGHGAPVAGVAPQGQDKGRGV